MLRLENTSWQQRYMASEIVTLRCRILDKPGSTASLIELFGKNDADLGDIIVVAVEPKHIIRDYTLFLKSKKQLQQIVAGVSSLKDVEIIKVSDQILEIHRRGAIDVKSRISLNTLTDLRMVYTPGVGEVCKKVQADPDSAWEYTGICDRVAICTDGTAVLGFGRMGVLPSLPVMEGKAAIFAEFVNVSAFPILIDTNDPDAFVETVCRIAAGFGAIQLEDVSAPTCFEIEAKLKQRLDIPVFHDDQHGTATVTLAALINALKNTNRKVEDSTVIMLGAGAAGIAITKILLGYGVGDIIVFDSTGPLYRGRTEKMNSYKDEVAQITNKSNFKGSLKDGFAGKDIFIGVAQPNAVTQDMVASMAKDAIVFPLSNPVGEISKEEAYQAGAAIAADGRDINNALAYPGIFRGALDVRARDITLEMKLAAAQAIAKLAPQGALLPSTLDRNVHMQIAKAVAKAWKG